MTSKTAWSTRILLAKHAYLGRAWKSHIRITSKRAYIRQQTFSSRPRIKHSLIAVNTSQNTIFQFHTSSMSQTNPHIHNGAQSGFAKADSYDAHRPSYPPEAFHKLLEVTHLLPEGNTKYKKVVLDLAAGTGKMTTLLAAHEASLQSSSSPLDIELIAIEPHPDMRAELERKNLPNVKVLVGAAEDIPLDEASVDVVIIAQAFHWFANKSALGSLSKVLKPGGILAVIWNVEDYNAPLAYPTPEWTHPMRQLLFDLDPRTPDENIRFRNEVWSSAFLPKPPSQYSQSGLQEAKFHWTVNLTKEELWKRWRTLSQIAILEGDDLEHAKKVFEEAINKADKDDQGKIIVGGGTLLAWIQRL